VPALPLTLAIGDYDHVRDLALGAVRAEGIELNVLDLPVEEIFFRFTRHREWDVSEMSFAKVVSLVSQEDRSLVPLPVFVSRAFRLSSIYVRRDGPVKAPTDLRGRRVGVPEWAQTAAIYSRGYLVHELGVPLGAIEWVQAGVNEPGRVEKVVLKLPADVGLRRPDARAVRGGSVPVWGRGQPAHARRVPAVRLRAGRLPSPARRRAPLPRAGPHPVRHLSGSSTSTGAHTRSAGRGGG
jgi:4,5-dihydroxyphthalate decarboxylase